MRKLSHTATWSGSVPTLVAAIGPRHQETGWLNDWRRTGEPQTRAARRWGAANIIRRVQTERGRVDASQRGIGRISSKQARHQRPTTSSYSTTTAQSVLGSAIAAKAIGHRYWTHTARQRSGRCVRATAARIPPLDSRRNPAERPWLRPRQSASGCRSDRGHRTCPACCRADLRAIGAHRTLRHPRRCANNDCPTRRTRGQAAHTRGHEGDVGRPHTVDERGPR